MKKENTKKKRPQTKNIWYDWLINFVLKPIKNDENVSEKIFKANTTKYYYKPIRGSRIESRKPKNQK